MQGKELKPRDITGSVERAKMPRPTGMVSDAGRSKLTTELIERMFTLTKKGLPLNKCCAMLNISTGTYQAWIREGKAYYEENELEKNYSYMTRVADLDYSDEAVATWPGILAHGDGRVDPYLCAQLMMAVERGEAEWQFGLIERSFATHKLKPTWVRDIKLLERRDRENWSPNEQKKDDKIQYDPDETFL